MWTFVVAHRIKQGWVRGAVEEGIPDDLDASPSHLGSRTHSYVFKKKTDPLFLKG